MPTSRQQPSRRAKRLRLGDVTDVAGTSGSEEVSEAVRPRATAVRRTRRRTAVRFWCSEIAAVGWQGEDEAPAAACVWVGHGPVRPRCAVSAQVARREGGGRWPSFILRVGAPQWRSRALRFCASAHTRPPLPAHRVNPGRGTAREVARQAAGTVRSEGGGSWLFCRRGGLRALAP